MGFKINPQPLVHAVVDVGAAGGATAEPLADLAQAPSNPNALVLSFKFLPTPERTQWLKRFEGTAEGDESQLALFLEVLTDWNVVDDADQPLPLNAQTLGGLFDVFRSVPSAVVQGYVQACFLARAKN